MSTQPIAGQWYRSTIEPDVHGKVIKAAGQVTLVRLANGTIDECRGDEFADSWEDENAEAVRQAEQQFHGTAQRNAIGGFVCRYGPECTDLVERIEADSYWNDIKGAGRR